MTAMAPLDAGALADPPGRARGGRDRVQSVVVTDAYRGFVRVRSTA